LNEIKIINRNNINTLASTAPSGDYSRQRKKKESII